MAARSVLGRRAHRGHLRKVGAAGSPGAGRRREGCGARGLGGVTAYGRAAEAEAGSEDRTSARSRELSEVRRVATIWS